LSLLAQLSDPHVDVGPGDAGSAEALAAAVRAVLRLDPAPDAVLMSGDVTNRADARSYERAAELLAPLSMPVHVLPGNHDDRAELRAAFPAGVGDDAGAADAPVRYAVGCGGLRLVVFDSTRPGEPGGAFDAAAAAWLASRLAEAPETPTIVATHHPPIEIGITELDEIGLPIADRARLAELLATCPQVRRVACGHVHRGAVGMVGGCPVVCCPSGYLHARLDLRPGADLVLEPGAPAFGLHVLVGGQLVSHVEAVRG